MQFDLPPSWQWSRCSEIARNEAYSCVGGPFGSRLTQKDYVVEPGVPVIRGVNLATSAGAFLDADFVYVSEEKADELKGHLAFPGDLVFTQRGTLGQVARIPEDAAFSRYVLSQSQMKLSVDERAANPDFVFFYFCSPWAQAYIRQHAITTGVPHINLSILRKFPVPLPSGPVQDRIAAALRCLNYKIALNRKTNRTLEEIAQTLFRGWFVDFEGETDLVESELGPIPRGWRLEPFSKAVEVNPRRQLTQGDEATYLEMKNLPTSGARAEEWRVRPYTSGSRFLNGDVLLARITPCLENGKTAFVDFLGEGEVGWGSTEFLVFRGRPPLPAEFVYFLVRTPEFRAYAIANMTGSSGRQRVRTQAFDHYMIPLPPVPVAERFGDFARVVFEALKARDEQSRTLAELRDTLLPKLISGEIRVAEAEEALEEAV